MGISSTAEGAIGRSECMAWQPKFDSAGNWSWTHPELANGWIPLVADHSQTFAPPRQTEYIAAAVCQWWIVNNPRPFATFAEAKTAALELGLAQLQASKDPNCRVLPE